MTPFSVPTVTHRALRPVSGLAGLLLVLACTDTDAPPPGEPTSDWTTGDPVAAGFDADALDALDADIRAGAFPNTHAVLVEHDGALVFEEYYGGSDERWGDPIPEREMGRDSLHDLRSISKSVTSALLGIALAAGSEDFETAVSRPVASYLPEIEVGEGSEAVTLHHVLTMTPGFEWNEMSVPYTDSTNDEIRLYNATDPAVEVLRRPVVHAPGSTWYYSGGTTQVLASIITELTGRTIDEFARENLFEPLGITRFEWLGPGAWTPDNPAAMSGLRLTARDLAKIGAVYLNGGRSNGRQVVPEEWVRRSSQRDVAEISEWDDGGIWGYGYQWWVGDLATGQRVVAGFGNGGQRLFILPGEDLVITVFAGRYNASGPYSQQILERILAARGGNE